VEKVLVCLLGSTRAHQLTFTRFKQRVLDELNADMTLALAIGENYDYANPFWQHAKYRWTVPFFSDFGKAFDRAQRWLCQERKLAAPDWRIMLGINGPWQGGIQSPDPQPGHALGNRAIQGRGWGSTASLEFYCRWLLLQGLKDDILDRYDRFVITRSDFVWLCPHPPLSILDRDAIWVPNDEHYGGLNARHLVVSRADVVNCLNLIEDILLKPSQLYDELKYMKVSNYNIEQFLAHHLRRKGLFHKVKMFPYVMYLARQVDDNSRTWSRGLYEPAVGHYIKYHAEFLTAVAYTTIIRSRADWESGAWRQFDPEPVASRVGSLQYRFRLARYRFRLARYHFLNVCKRESKRIVSALKRPGRVGRFQRSCKRLLQKTKRKFFDHRAST
jgi:hypothetical protein